MTTQADVDAIKQALAERRAGRQVTKISVAGRAVEYAAMTIDELEGALARAQSELAGVPRRRALKIYFGG